LRAHLRQRKEQRVRRVAIDTETTGLNVWTGCRPFAVSYFFDDGEWGYWEWEVDPLTREPIVSSSEAAEIRELVGDPSIVKSFFNLKFDVLMLRAIGIETAEPWAEVGFMARAVHNLMPVFKLKPLAKRFAGIGDDDEKDLRDGVVKCRRIAKKLGWKLATRETHGDHPLLADYWLPNTLLAQGHGDELKAAEIDPELCRVYCVKDAERTILLDSYYRGVMLDLGERDPRGDDHDGDKLDVQGVYDREMELLPLTMEMESHGVRVDAVRLEELIRACEEARDLAADELLQLAGSADFNANSPIQVAALLFEPERRKDGEWIVEPGRCQNLEVLERTEGERARTNGSNLMPHRANKVVDALLRQRANEKALSTFFYKYKSLWSPDIEGAMILHPGFHQWGTLTGRFTCAAPNLQQVSNPKTTSSRIAEYVVDARQAFVPRNGYIWYCPDYDQLEVILFADIAGEEIMLDSIRKGLDFHTAATNRVYGGRDNPRTLPAMVRTLELVGEEPDEQRAIEILDAHDWEIVDAEKSVGSKMWRKIGKTVTFVKIFGGGITALMGWIGCSRIEAYEMLADYDSSFPDLTDRMTDLANMGRRDGFVVNRWGRMLWVNKWKIHTTINYLVQSAAADLMKQGMRRCARYLKETGLDARIVLTVHDELIFEIRRGHNFKHVLRRLCEIMANHDGRFSIETPVSMERVDERWSDKYAVDLGASA
jgi:DNA polymerase I-like protein with 3'-5' exonuclease and polymerase domains